MATLAECQQALQDNINMLRGLYRLVTDMDFISYYDEASENDKRKILLAILKGDRSTIFAWLRQHKDLETLPMRQLRKIASDLGVLGYAALSKASLLSEIENARAIKKN